MNEDRDYVAKLQELRAKYKDVVKFVRAGKDFEADKVCVQLKVDGVTLQAKGRTRVGGKYVDIFDLEPQIEEQIKKLQEKKEHDKLVLLIEGADEDALATGKRMLASLGATTKWITGHYIAIHIPARDENPPVTGWLRFWDWAGREPRRRAWSDHMRSQLHASGMYAWMVAVDLQQKRLRLYYSGPGKAVSWATKWFPLDCGALYHELINATKHADQYEWRARELREVEIGYLGEGKEAREQNREQRRAARRALREAREYKQWKKLEAERAQWIAEQMAEMAENEGGSGLDDDDEDEWADPNTPKTWSGDLTERYVDDSSDQNDLAAS